MNSIYDDARDSSTADPLSVRFNPDKSRPSLILLFSLVFIGISLKVILEGNPEGWFLLVIFTLSTLACLSVVLPGASFLEIDTTGVTIASSFRRKLYRWDQIERMGIFQVGMIRRVGVDLNARYPGPERVPNFNKSASGYHVSLPAMSELELESLLDLMERCRQECLKLESSSATLTTPAMMK